MFRLDEEDMNYLSYNWIYKIIILCKKAFRMHKTIFAIIVSVWWRQERRNRRMACYRISGLLNFIFLLFFYHFSLTIEFITRCLKQSRFVLFTKSETKATQSAPHNLHSNNTGVKKNMEICFNRFQ